MRAAVYHGRRDVRVEEVPDPPRPRDDEIVIEVGAASLCGTDLSEFVHGPRMIPVTRPHPATGHLGPTVIGHEFAGRVVAAGTRVDRLVPGTRVVCGGAVSCGTCGWCRAGRTNLCERYFVYGLHAHGGLASYATVRAASCVAVPDTCSDLAAPIAQPLAVALHALRRSGVEEGQSLAVIGVGGIGSLVVAAAAAIGAEPLVALDVDPDRLRTAERLGATAVADTSGAHGADHAAQIGPDLVIEASGTPAGLRLALDSARRGGQVHLVGIQPGAAPLDLHDTVVNEVDISTSNGLISDRDLPDALDLLARGNLPELMTDRVIQLDAVASDGLVPMASGNTHGKVVVRPS